MYKRQTKYIVTYLTARGADAARDGYFTAFITSKVSPIFFMLAFLAATAFIVYRGVEKGIEKFSKIIMPGLIFMIVGIALFSLTLKYTDADGVTRTGLQGLGVYIIPNLDGITGKRFLEILLDAMSQLFFSLSVSMGIMITYGSYVKKDVDLNRSLSQIEFFDTGVAFLAGMMIIPAVFAVSYTHLNHYYSGMVYPPAFGSVLAVSDLLTSRLLRTCIVTAAALTIGILYLTIGVKTGEERQKMTLFALSCLAFSLYAVYPLFHQFGAGIWSYRLEDVSFYLFLLMLTALHCSLCGIDGRPRRIVLGVGISVAFLSLVLSLIHI